MYLQVSTGWCNSSVIIMQKIFVRTHDEQYLWHHIEYTPYITETLQNLEFHDNLLILKCELFY